MSERSQPRIAVIIPCYRDGALALEAVASVEEHEPIEIAVIDDGSEDAGTIAALEQLEGEGIKVVRHGENRGLPAARTSGLRATGAPYVYPFDADDLAVPNALGPMVDRLEEHPEAAVCFGDYVEFGSSERLRRVPAQIDPFRLAYTNEYPVSAMFRREALEAVGAWHPIDAYEDWHLWMTLAERGMLGVHFGFGLITYRRRVHGERMLTRARRSHRRLYAQLRADHPRLFSELREHRNRSHLYGTRKALYPIVYGRRPRFRGEISVKNFFENLGIWTVQR